jgi:23S rRNA pseudouridine955/2504/2580 synthase
MQKKSETSYRIIVTSQDYSLLEMTLGTGRMHQIRRHLAMINHPVLGDDKYGDFALNKQLRKTVGLKRLLLHACRLKIEPCILLPQGLDIYAPAPDSFLSFFPAN